MNRFVAMFAGSLVAAGLSAGLAYAHEGHDHGKAGGDDDKEVTIQGELIDTACFVSSDGDAKGKDHADCARKCMASGIPAGILPEGKKASDMMYLLTSPTALAPYAAQTIKVEGTAHADMHAVDVTKVYVKDGDNWKEVPLKDEHHNMAGGGEHAEGGAPAATGGDGHAGHKH